MPSQSELAQAREQIMAELGSGALSASSDTLVYGSTSIQDFIRESGVPTVERTGDQLHPIAVSIDALEALYDDISRHPYDDRRQFFPFDPGFMYGADMSLLNVLCVSEYLGAEQIVPTNLNLSDGILSDLANR